MGKNFTAVYWQFNYNALFTEECNIFNCHPSRFWHHAKRKSNFWNFRHLTVGRTVWRKHGGKLMMRGRNTQKGSEEKSPLAQSIVIKLPIKYLGKDFTSSLLNCHCMLKCVHAVVAESYVTKILSIPFNSAYDVAVPRSLSRCGWIYEHSMTSKDHQYYKCSSSNVCAFYQGLT